MGKIQKLSDQLTNMIAAGEVVERPSGVVKELVENAIDAGADHIIVRIEDGGLKKIQVVDNGSGMDAIDASNALQRHATSKINKVDDLWNIHTMGFRGEALPSIASVSKFDLLTNDGNDSTQVKVEYGKVVYVGPKGAAEGTSVTVEDLFYKTPARLKHMRSSSFEANAIYEVIERFAISKADIAFSFYNNDILRLETSGSGDLIEVIYQIFGKDIAENAKMFSFEDYDFHCDGVIVMPGYNRSSRRYIQIYLNDRMIRSYSIQKAIIKAYEPYLPKDRYPICFIKIKAESRLVDVNVHPSKWEVRLSKQKQLDALIENNVSAALKQFVTSRNIPVSSVSEMVISEPKVEYRPEKYVQPSFDMLEEKNETVIIEKEKEEVIVEKKKLPTLKILGQYHLDYIIAEGEDGLYVIDQHAAAERMNFERLSKLVDKKPYIMQPLIVPLVIDMTAKQLSSLDEINLYLNEIGLNIESFGNDSGVIREVPVWMSDMDIKVIVQDGIEMWQEEDMKSRSSYLKHAVATMACHGSIRFNRTLSMEEMKKVVDDLNQCEQPYHCPHGRPTIIKFSDLSLRREFERG